MWFRAELHFFYETNNTSYLLTNWHNVSGKDPFTGAFLSSSQKCPTKLVVKLATWVAGGDPRTFCISPTELD